MFHQHFENIWLDQQKENNIRVVESSKLEIEVLTYQPKQGGHLRVTKEEL
jgi:hypothetical protein